MSTRKFQSALLVVCIALFAAWPALAADGEKSTVKGLITAIDGDTITVRDQNNVDHRITLSADTQVKMRKGLTGKVMHEKTEASSLMPGLPIVADVVAEGDAHRATAISYRSEDFRTAQQVQAGVNPTSTRVDAMGKRMDDFGTYEALAEADVLFDSGSTTISEKGRSDLMALAEQAKQTKDYRVVLQGFTDATGNAEANQRLSTRRAAAVSNFLQQQGGLSPGRVMTPDGMGVAPDAGSGSNATARKVTVKLVVDKGVNAAGK